MGPPTDSEHAEIHITRWELEKEREHAVISAKLEQLDTVIPEVYSTLKGMEKKISDIPMDIISCKDRLDKEMKVYMHDEFVTNVDLQRFESKLEKQITKDINGMRTDLNSVRAIVWKAMWIVSGFICAATAIFWILAHTNITVT